MEKIKYLLIAAMLPALAIAQDPQFGTDNLSLYSFDRNVIEYSTGTLPTVLMESETGTRYSGDFQRKSAFLAAIMSAAVPGVGEAYTGNWWRAIMHAGIEVAGWSLYLHYDGRGDSQTALYKRYANNHWDVTRYAEWLNVYWGGQIRISDDSSLPPWERVDWSEIHEVERRYSHFSHTLEPYDTQQYYELIGKYPQYTRGWEDSHPVGNFLPTETEVTAEQTAYFDDISEMFKFYSGKRGYANTLYARAHNAVLAVFLNHFASAFHAAFLAHRYNQTHLSMDIEYRDDLYGVRYVPTINLHIGF
jgi:hypothetical protein